MQFISEVILLTALLLSDQIDEARYYNYARTPAQIAWDYNRGKPVGWWKLDDGQGSVALDWSGNKNHGTLTNMTPANDWVTGKFNKALDFDGSNDYVDYDRQPCARTVKCTFFMCLDKTNNYK